MKNLYLFIFCVFVTMAFSQRKCEGVLLDSTTSQAIEFANIGIVGKGFGTVTNDKGEFSFSVPDSLQNEPIKISMIGYKSKTLSLQKLSELRKVNLSQSATNLNEVSVAVKKTKIKILGNETQTKSMTAGFTKNTLGAELAIRLNIKHPKTHLRKFYINIANNSIEKPIFRFNVYSKDEKGLPKENILSQSVIIEFKETTGLIELDFTPYNIYVDDDVFISLEWIKDLGDVKGLFFSTKLVGSPTYFRQASQDKWAKIPIGVGLYAEIAY